MKTLLSLIAASMLLFSLFMNCAKTNPTSPTGNTTPATIDSAKSALLTGTWVLCDSLTLVPVDSSAHAAVYAWTLSSTGRYITNSVGTRLFPPSDTFYFAHDNQIGYYAADAKKYSYDYTIKDTLSAKFLFLRVDTLATAAAVSMANATEIRKLVTAPVDTTHPAGHTAGFALIHADTAYWLGTCYFAHPDSLSEWAYWIIPVVNKGNTTVTYINLNNITFKNASNVTLATNPITYVQGKNLKVGSFYTTSCLAPGDTGYFVGIQNSIYSQLASITADSITNANFSFSTPAANIAMSSFTAQGSQLIISVHNSGASSAVLAQSYSIQLDSTGIPLTWSFVSPHANAVIAVGGTDSLSGLVSYNGTWNHVKVFPMFHDTVAAATKTYVANAKAQVAPALSDEDIRALIDARNQQELENSRMVR